MRYKRAPIEIESPEQIGYDSIDCNLAESSVKDIEFDQLGIEFDKIKLGYADHVGKRQLRERIAAETKGLIADDVLLTAGAAAGLFIVATSMLEKKDEIIVQFPNYATNIDTPLTIGCSVKKLELKFEENFRMDISSIEKLITKRTKLISITNPHNPTGTVISEGEINKLVEIAERKNIFLLIDETYRELQRGVIPPPAASRSPKVISISSLSKAFGLPGIRIGWIITKDPDLQTRFLAAKEQIYVCNPVLEEEIAYHCLKQKNKMLLKVKKEVNRNFKIIEEWIVKQRKLEWVCPEGGVICFPRIIKNSGIKARHFYRILTKKYKTFVGPGHWFGMDDRYMRIGYGWPPATELKRGLNNIDKALEEASN